MNEKYRREEMRWRILQTAEVSYPGRTKEAWIWRTLDDLELIPSVVELRKELAYLEGKGLLAVEKTTHPLGQEWMVELTATGIDYLEYTVDELPGIPRPPQY